MVILEPRLVKNSINPYTTGHEDSLSREGGTTIACVEKREGDWVERVRDHFPAFAPFSLPLPFLRLPHRLEP